MSQIEQKPYVAAILGNRVRVCGAVSSVSEALAEFRWVVGQHGAEFPFSEEPELAEILSALQAAGLPFADEPAGWPPAAVFQQLRERGLVDGKIKTISWTGPNQPLHGAT